MTQVQIVAPEWVYSVWPKVVGFIEASIAQGTGEYSAEHMKDWLVTGQQFLLVGICDNEIIGCATLKFINYPNDRVAFITSCAGKGIVTPEVFSQVEDWARLSGATKIQAWAKDAQTRLYKQAVGFNTPCNIVEKPL